MNEAHSAGRSSCGKMAVTGHSSTHRPQSMHVSGSMYSISSAANFSVSSLVGWMQSTGQTATQAVSFVPMQGWAMMWAIARTPQPLKVQDEGRGKQYDREQGFYAANRERSDGVSIGHASAGEAKIRLRTAAMPS